MARKNQESPVVIYRMKVTLEHSRPPIWRRLLVPSDTILGDLHYIIQAAFGWKGYHLHQFIVGEAYFGEPHLDYGDYLPMHDERKVRLEDIFGGEGSWFRYEYDFGDGWMHRVLVEKVLPVEAGQEYPVCIKGRRACPPEDVGGIWRYHHFLEAIADENREERKEYLEWLGGPFDPEAFDLEATNRALRALQLRSRSRWQQRS